MSGGFRVTYVGQAIVSFVLLKSVKYVSDSGIVFCIRRVTDLLRKRFVDPWLTEL